MNEKKRVTPYQRLAAAFDAYRLKVRFPRMVCMFYYPKAKLGDNWSLLDLYERTKAAGQLGYDVQLYATDEGLEVKYVQKRPE